MTYNEIKVTRFSWTLYIEVHQTVGKQYKGYLLGIDRYTENIPDICHLPLGEGNFSGKIILDGTEQGGDERG